MNSPLTLTAFIRRPALRPWQGGEKIPWNDPDFSRRMLVEHLSQEHDWASRRGDIITRHVRQLAKCLPAPPARVLDLGCGPGFYTRRLAEAGHACTGVDFSPASLAFARQEAARAGLHIDYAEADIRDFRPQGLFDAVLLTFGEINVFTRQDARIILASACAALKPGGFLLLESQTFDAVKAAGQAPPSWHSAQQGLFSDAPHLCLEEHAWDEASATASTRYAVIDAATCAVRLFHSSMCAHTGRELEDALAAAGFAAAQKLAPEDWPPGEAFAGKMECRVCRKGGD